MAVYILVLYFAGGWVSTSKSERNEFSRPIVHHVLECVHGRGFKRTESLANLTFDASRRTSSRGMGKTWAV